MRIDESRFPLVYLRSDADTPSAEKRSPEVQLEALLDRGQRFVLIAAQSPDGEDESHEERKQRALFFKRIKERLRRLCAGAIIIESGKPTPMPLRLAAQAMGKAFGFSFAFVATEEEAADRAQRLLEASAA